VAALAATIAGQKPKVANGRTL